MSYKCCPPSPLCTVAPIIASRVYGSGRLFQPWPLAAQAPGYAYIDGYQNPATPLLPCTPCGPNAPQGAVPRAPDGFTTDVVGAGILSPIRWRGAGVFADNYALPGDIAREPNEGWWASESIDADTGKRSWITGMSGLGGGLGAFSMPSWFNSTFISIGGVRIPNWLGYGLLAFIAYKIAKKRGFIKNARRGRRRNARGEYDQHAARELEVFIENDGNLYRQMYTPIIKNLTTKVARGQYDHAKAVKGFMYLVDEGGKRDVNEFHISGTWHETFNTATRRAVAESLAKSFEEI